MQAVTSYRAEVVPVPSLEPSLPDVLAEIYLRHYDGGDRARFAADLSSKDEIVLLRHDQTPVGFTTLSRYRRTWHGRPVRIVFSGDTIVDAAHWGQQALAFTWIAHLGDIWRQEPATPLYWFLIVKGHRTYKYLPAFGKTFHPHWAAPRPELAELAGILATEKFGADYNSISGVVEFPVSRGHLKPEYARPGPEELNKAAVRYFLERNPGYTRGHELVCLCEIAPDNMKPLTRRLFEKGLS